MSTTQDNQLTTQVSGTADWDTALNANFNLLERGAHFVGQLGVAVNTGQVLWQNSGGFLFPANVASESVRPEFLALTAGGSGDTVQTLRNGIVRSLGVHSNGIIGQRLYVDAKSPGIVVGSYSGAFRPIGHKISDWGMIFDPHMHNYLPEKLSRVTTISAVVASNHLFSIDVGKRGWNRRVLIQGSSSLVTLKFYSGSTRAGSELLYETFSGGVTCVGSFLDQAGFPFENTEASTISGLIFGLFSINSGSNVTTGDIGITAVVDRFQ